MRGLVSGAMLAVLSAGPSLAQTADVGAATFFLTPEPDASRSLLGGGLYQLPQAGVGYYLNGAVSVADTDPFYDSLAIGAFGDPVTDRFGMGYVLNVGGTVPLNRNVAFYGGVGVAGVSGVAEQFDSSLTLSPGGTYYVNDPAVDDVQANFNAGALLSTGQIAIDAGYNSYFRTGYLGVGFRF